MLLATRRGDVELRSGVADPVIPPRPGSGPVGQPVTSWTVGGVPAFTRAVRILAEGVASLRLRVWRGDGVTRREVTTVWQARLFRDALSLVQTRFQAFETVQESLSKRGNAYVWKNTDPATGRVVELVALHPDQVMPMLDQRGTLRYQVGVGYGFVDPTGRGPGFYTVSTDVMLHIRGHGDGGALIAPSPIQLYRMSLGTAIAKLAHEARTYDRGTALRLAVEMPATITPEQAREWRDLWQSTYGGTDGATTAVLGGGGQIKPIGISMADAQFIESQNFGVEEAARIVGVPASLLDVTTSSTSSPKTPEWEQTRLLRYGLGPALERIESALLLDPSLFGRGSAVYPAFDTQKFIRGDLTTEAQIALSKVQSGQWLVDEARALDGLEPLPDGVGAIPQVTPVGGAPNPFPPAGAGGDPLQEG